jgi:hypothetical protein
MSWSGSGGRDHCEIDLPVPSGVAGAVGVSTADGWAWRGERPLGGGFHSRGGVWVVGSTLGYRSLTGRVQGTLRNAASCHRGLDALHSTVSYRVRCFLIVYRNVLTTPIPAPHAARRFTRLTASIDPATSYCTLELYLPSARHIVRSPTR